jgi:pimeloyl-ACP methyl ester carboxylesterase
MTIEPVTFERKELTVSTGTVPYLMAGAGPALLYLHAAGGPMLTPFLQGMAAKHTVYIPILPGFMGTPLHPGVSLVTHMAALAGEFAEALFGEPVDVMGASFGGWTALWLAVMRPDVVKSLVVEAPAGLRFGHDATTLTPEITRANLFAYPEKAAAVAFPREVAIANSQAAATYSAGLFVDQALADRVHEIQSRTFIVMATKDITVPAETGRFLAHTIPKAHLTYIYDAAHAVEVDQPEAMLRVVGPFLEKGAAFIVAESRTAL